MLPLGHGVPYRLFQINFIVDRIGPLKRNDVVLAA